MKAREIEQTIESVLGPGWQGRRDFAEHLGHELVYRLKRALEFKHWLCFEEGGVWGCCPVKLDGPYGLPYYVSRGEYICSFHPEKAFVCESEEAAEMWADYLNRK